MSALTVRDLMTSEVESLFEDETVDLAKTIMELGRIRHLPVISRADELVGLVTHRDILRASAAALAENKENAQMAAVDIMTTGIATIASHAPALEAAEIMFREKYGCMPVVDDGKLVGIITEADFVQLAIRQLSDPGT